MYPHFPILAFLILFGTETFRRPPVNLLTKNFQIYEK